MITNSIKAGNIYAIPLFLPRAGINGDMKENMVSYSKQSFKDKGKEFAYCRVIKDLGASGILVEVFDIIGGLNIDPKEIISSKRLFNPIPIFGLGIKKKRWKKIYDDPDYDAERDSNFSEIRIVKGMPPHLLELWQNYALTPISETEALKYERWRVWLPTELEERIKNELFD